MERFNEEWDRKGWSDEKVKNRNDQKIEIILINGLGAIFSVTCMECSDHCVADGETKCH